MTAALGLCMSVCMSVASVVWPYDTEIAASYAQLFAPAEGVKMITTTAEGRELYSVGIT